MRVAWLAPYPVQTLEPAVKLARRLAHFHPCSWIVHMSEALANRSDMELHLITESQLVTRREVARVGRITFHVLRSGIPFVARGWPPWFPVELWQNWQPNITRLCREIREVNPDVVHAHGTEHPFALAALASGYPSVISIQGLIGEYQRVEPHVGLERVARLELEAIRRGQCFIAQSQYVHRYLQMHNSAARIHDIDLAIDPRYFEVAPAAKRERVIFVGSISPRKGFPEALEAFAVFHAAHPQTTLSIVGYGDAGFVQQQQTLAAKLCPSNTVEWLGFRRANEIMELFREAAMLMVPSRAETYCCVVAEGMAAGLPIVATNIGGIDSLLEHERSGLLVPPQDPRAMAMAMKRLMQDANLARRLAETARAVARKRFDGNSIANRFCEVYRELMSNR